MKQNKLYLYPKPDCHNINGLYYPFDVLMKAVNEFNKKNKKHYIQVKFNYEDSYSCDMKNAMAMFREIKYDKEKHQFYIEFEFINDYYKNKFNMEGLIITIAGIGNIKDHKIIKYNFTENFYLCLKSEVEVVKNIK